MDAARGVGLLDFIAGHDRASGEVALHVLEIMTKLLESADDGGDILKTEETQQQEKPE